MLNMFRLLFKQHKTHPELASIEHTDLPFTVTVRHIPSLQGILEHKAHGGLKIDQYPF